MNWELSEPREGIKVLINPQGVWLKSEKKLTGNEIRESEARTRLGRLLPTLIPQLLQLGIAQEKSEGILIPFDNFADMEGTEIDAFDDLVPWSPLSLEIETRGSLGMPEFKYKTIFYWGLQQVHVERIGCFAKRSRTIYRLERETYRILEAIENFNNLPPSEKVKAEVLPKFSEIKGIAQEIGAQLNKYLLSEKIIVPAKIDLDMVEEKDGRISFYPKIEGVSDRELFQIFMAGDDIDDVFAIPDGESGRIRVILNDSQKEVLRRMRKVRHLGGPEKAKVLRNPYEIFDGVASSVEIDLSKFGPRVKGVGNFPFASQPFIKYEGTGIFNKEGDVGSSKFNAGIKCTYADGTEEKLYFDKRKEAFQLLNESKAAFQSGQQTVNFKGRTIVVDKAFIESLNELEKRITGKKRDHKDVSTEHAYLLIYTNEDELEYKEDEIAKSIDASELSLPGALLCAELLKQYQKEGIEWLQRNYLLHERSGRKGCLLADEMGLGKTIQVLVFLSWLIERGGISPDPAQSKEKSPWSPILIIAPLMLLENESWQKDMKKFFKHDGSIFEPILILHGAELKRMRHPDVKGRETDIRRSVLKMETLRQYRTILTSYETVVNYQFSFAMMKDKFTAVITDEAQEYKTPNTKISHALKSLAPKIRIACTGTPVETKLMDVWNILDFLQPGLLGSASEFASLYEKPIIEDPLKRDAILSRLKKRLCFGQPQAYVLRRDKKSILHELPRKYEHKEYCHLSTKQKEMHIDFISEVRKGGHPFSVLSQLMKLYQHPDLIPSYEGISENEMDGSIAKSPKLKRLIELMRDIRRKKEKVLIFTRSLNMQQMLSMVLSFKFGLHVDIINGAMPREGGTKTGIRTRKEGIERFCASDGFNVLVVSPDVAGVGLTIVEANHVIHYGRWWNPAKEMQATDRVYRIGQSKDVHVYYLIAQDPEGKIVSFDEKLDNLLDRRRELASDFLAPMPGDNENQADLVRELMEDGKPLHPIKTLSIQDVKTLLWDRFEALIALLHEKNMERVILTPRSGDYGADVLSAKGKEIKLIQCKHSAWDAPCDIDVISEVINAFDLYKSRWLRKARGIMIKPCIFTNGTFTKSAKNTAREHDIMCFDSGDCLDMLKKHPCTLAEIEMMENRRKPSMKQVEEDIREWLYENKKDLIC